uniref:Uncharacterized protein n=1 Tax=Avena sativa TaxID=4498 RepID=A0ACD5XU68_AVESA
MAGRREQPTKDELMDGAIHQFGPMGYAEADIRSTVEQLIQMYGEEGMWLLQEDEYLAVQDALFEKQELDEQQQRLLVQEEPNKQNESAMSEASVKRDPMLIDRPAPEATMPCPAATGTSRARRPCYGWISDSDYEEYLASRQQGVK